MTRFYEYLEKLRDPHYKTAVKIAWLYPDETVQKEFTNEIYDISGNISVNYQNGARRSCTITLSNDKQNVLINYSNIWFGQKFQVWVGLYLNDNTPYYISQGIFYVSNPKAAYDPAKRTLTLQGVDKWAYLDGSLFGNLPGTYVSQINQDIRELVNGLICKSRFDNKFIPTSQLADRVDPKQPLFLGFEGNLGLAEVQAYEVNTKNLVYQIPSVAEGSPQKYFIICKKMENTKEVTFVRYCQKEVLRYENGIQYCEFKAPLDDTNISEIIPSSYEIVTRQQSIFLNPYTMTTDKGKTLADMVLEYATVLFADVYYDNNGYLCFVARNRSVQDMSVYDKEHIWEFSASRREILGLELSYEFTKLYNDIVVLGQIINGKQIKAHIQNQDYASDTNVFKIGIKTKPPYESDQYYSKELCLDMAKYYAQLDMAMDKTGTIKTLPIYHMDVNKIITISDIYNTSKEEFLVTGFSLALNPISQMSLNISNLKYFTTWTEVIDDEEEVESQ